MVELVGYENFKRHNPRSDKFKIHKFHHIEFWCADATNTFKRFQHGLGMTLVAKSDHSTGNSRYCSYVLQSNDLTFTFTAPYSRKCAAEATSSCEPLPDFDQQQAYDFICTHGFAARAIGLLVEDAAQAYEVSVAKGAKGVRAPTRISDAEGSAVVSEVIIYGDVVLRYISGDWKSPFLPGYAATPDEPQICYGLQRLDHAVGNVPKLIEQVEYVMGFTGFHEFAEFVAADVGTVDSGLNSMVLANNNEMVLLPINEPTFGTKRKSQIQTYLEQNEGSGLQHLALKTNNVIQTMREMFSRSRCGGFEFQAAPGPNYYRRARERIGDVLSDEEWAAVEEMGILVDKDDQGVLLQIFTKPLSDRPTIFIEIIERRGCLKETKPAASEGAAEQSVPSGGTSAADRVAEVEERFKDIVAVREDGVLVQQAAGCGGFGKGNFSELFKSIEEYERTLKV